MTTPQHQTPEQDETQSAFTFLPLGAIIQEFRVGGQNIVLNFPTQSHYVKYNTPHFGETIGRVANRVKDAVLHNLNGGREYPLPQNSSPNSIHGGDKGWGKRVFDGSHAVERNGRKAMMFKYLSPDGEEGYPGSVEVRVWYTASKEGEGKESKTVLTAEYEVEFVGDECEETVVNLTNHSYFDISGGPTVEGTQAQLSTNQYLVTDEYGIPNGNVESFHRPLTSQFTLGPSQPHVDNCFVIDDDPAKIPLDTRNEPLKLLAQFNHPRTKLHLEVHSTEPAFQFYTGKFVDVPEVDGAPPRTEGAGFCVEPGRYINAANDPNWRSMCLLRKGEVYGCKNVYKAWKAE